MATDDFFRSRLDAMIDRQHPLAVLTTRMPYSEIEAALATAFEHKDRGGKVAMAPTSLARPPSWWAWASAHAAAGVCPSG